MSIAFLIGSLSNSGGTQRMLTLLCNELVHTHSITIFIHKKGDSFFPLDKRIAVQVLKGNLWQKNRQIYKTLKQNKISYYISLDSNSVLLNGLILPKCTKLIIWEHFSLENNYKKLLFSLSRFYAAFRAYKFVVLSEIERDLWQQKYRLKNEKIKVIYNPITIKENLLDRSNKREFKRILAIGNNVKIKGFDILLKAWKKIRTDWSLEIIGLPDKEQKKLQELINQDKIKRINIRSKVQDITKYYKNASIFVLPSRKEATPLVLIESQAFGLPVIAFNHLSSVREIAGNSIIYANYASLENGLAEEIKTLILYKESYLTYHKNSLHNAKKFSLNFFLRAWTSILHSKI